MEDGLKRVSRLQRDDELTFPHFYLVSASAGSGKTYTLCMRFCQFLLSKCIQNNNLSNIIALTFTKNAANEMKQRILEWLKRISLGLLSEDDKNNLIELLSLPFNEIVTRSEKLIDLIFNNFYEFQVSTIDSFMSKIFKVMAFETNILASNIKIDIEEIIDFAVDKFIQDIDFLELEEFIKVIASNNSISFNPKEDLKKNLLTLLNLENRKLGYFKENKDIEPALDKVKLLMRNLALLAEKSLRKSFKLNGKIKEENFYKLIEKLNNPEKNIINIIKSIYKTFPFNKEKSDDYIYLKSEWEKNISEIYTYLPILSQIRFQPYIKLLSKFKLTLENCYKDFGAIYIGNMNKMIFENLNEETITKIQFCLGSYVYHILIDEFQDTDEVQWACIKKLCDDLLSRNGSVFAVGDIKQSIYSFRGANYKIMKETIEKPTKNTFLLNLEKNFRTDGIIIENIKNFFQRDISDKVSETNNISGLKDFIQFPLEERKNSGFFKSQIVFFDEPEDKEILDSKDVRIGTLKTELLNLIYELSKRYKLSDIVVLARSNSQVNKVATWLIENGYNVVSESSMDIRDRKIIREIVSLLKFIELPNDNLNFSIFILGKIMNKIFVDNNISQNEIREFIFLNRNKNLFNSFKNNYIDLWNKYFKEIYFKSGYISMYNLITLIYSIFKIPENFPEESAYLVKLLEIISEIELTGYVDINKLLYLIEQDKSEFFRIEISNFTDALKLMTVHKAKGLEFPVVINVIDAENNYALINKKKLDYSFFIYEEKTNFEADKSSLSLLHITREVAQKNNFLNEILSDKDVDCILDDLNLLYVAMTRAKFELYNFMCIKKIETSDNLYNLEKEDGEKKKIIDVEVNDFEFDNFKINYEFTVEPLGIEQNWKKNDIASIKRGILFHKILERIKYKEDLFGLENITKLYENDIKLFEPEIAKKISSIVMNEQFSKFFSPLNKIFTEVDFVDKKGNLFRIDRLVIEKDIIYVVDYKTSLKEYYKNFEKKNYLRQIKLYMKLVKNFYRRSTVGVILDIDNMSKEIIKDE
ncbi:UvrD/REP helicase [Thermodesulfobium narugense DSM 14796]|uniref:DNA 3'-5' helicase n=1 Tax=Thermodesulfobium narugense DSM 14796 TaxID=747365 RepID=M1E7H4_9BACT|nr:UvrD-helicase domain-containing protein [Thermodesulfobium narugense]AEE14648.1 UvrD/REP helicase [Thermodesulfobium narugense DSM 14796]